MMSRMNFCDFDTAVMGNATQSAAPEFNSIHGQVGAGAVNFNQTAGWVAGYESALLRFNQCTDLVRLLLRNISTYPAYSLQRTHTIGQAWNYFTQAESICLELTQKGSNNTPQAQSALTQQLVHYQHTLEVLRGELIQVSSVNHVSQAGYTGLAQHPTTGIQATHAPIQMPIVNSAFGTTAAFIPQNLGIHQGAQTGVCLTETPTAFQAILDMPGIRAEDIFVEIEQGVLFIRGIRHANNATNSQCLYNTLPQGVIARQVPLTQSSQSLDLASLSASLDNGLLTVSIRKSATANCNSVKVNTGGAARQS